MQTSISLKRNNIFQKGKHHSFLLWKALQISSSYFYLIGTYNAGPYLPQTKRIWLLNCRDFKSPAFVKIYFPSRGCSWCVLKIAALCLKSLEYMYINLDVRRVTFDCDVFIISFLFRCIALTAELTNGTFIGMRGCFYRASGNCSTSACNERNESLSGPPYFARCVVECCTEENCNTNLFPMLPTKPSSTVEVVSSSTAVSQNTTTQPDTTTDATKPPTSLGIKMRAFLYLPVFLLVTLDIMN